MKKLLYILLSLAAIKSATAQTIPASYIDQILVVGKDSILAFDKYYLDPGAEAFQHLYLSTNEGASWRDMEDSTPYDGKTMILSDGSLLHGTSGDCWGGYAGLYRSTNLGKSWTQIRKSIVTDFCALGTNEYCIDVGIKGPLCDVEANDSLLYTSDVGYNWEKILELDPYLQSTIDHVNAFQHKIYVNAYGKLLSSADQGKVWDTVADINRPILDSNEGAGTVSVNNENIFCQRLIYSTTSFGNTANNTSLLISSSGNPGSWVERAVPFYKYQTSTGIPLVAKDGKLFTMGFLSCDSGKTWLDFSKNFQNIYTSDSRYLTGIAIDSSGRCFYGDGENILSSSDCGTSWTKTSLADASVPEDINTKTFSVFPNPATTSATITYSLPHSQYIKLELIDQLGRSIEIIRNGIEESGDKNISLSLSKLPDGLYYLRMQMDEGMISQKIAKIGN